jgi:hypothetical protein
VGLVIAEIELNKRKFYKPDWLAEEVTNDARYYNSYLSLFPQHGRNYLTNTPMVTSIEPALLLTISMLL